MRREILSVSNTEQEAFADLEALTPNYEDGDLGIEEIFNEIGEFEGFGVVWTSEE